MTTASKLISVARSQLGVKENPAGSNKVKYTRWYPMIGPWCAMFVSWCAAEAGIPTSVIPKHAWTPAGKSFFQKRKQWGSKPRVGALAYYNLSGLGRVSHVGIVERVYKDGSFDAIEGNTDARGGRTGGKVMRKRRKAVGRGGGFGYPAYPGGAPKNQTSKKSKTTGTKNGYRIVGYGELLRLGVYGAPVKEWQEKALGYTGKSADGFFGPATERDTRAFQKKHGVKADGIVGPQTWPLRSKGAKPKPKPKAKGKPFPLPKGHWYGPESSDKRNHSGYWEKDRPAIRDIQRKVGTGVDGGYGRATKRKVEDYQRRHKLTVDGGVGVKTWDHMFNR